MFSNLPILDYLTATTEITFPSPKGGSATALTGALAASLVQMSINVAKKRKPCATEIKELEKLKIQSQGLMEKLVTLIDEDAQTYHQVIQAYKEKQEKIVLSQKFLDATVTLCQIARLNQDLLHLIEKLLPLCPPSCQGDLEMAANLAQAAIKSAGAGIKANENKITDEAHQAILQEKLIELKPLVK